MTMQIRPIPRFVDKNGNIAANASIYVGAFNTNPKDPSSWLVVRDNIGNAVLSQPIKTDSNGIAKNSLGSTVIPVIQEEAYSILIESESGGELFSAANLPSDAFGLAAGTASADANYDTFEEAQSADLSTFDFIFIRSATGATGADWRGTVGGPGYSYYAYRTGETGPAGTGTFDDFYDAGSNRWRITTGSNLPLSNEDRLDTLEPRVAQNELDISQNESDIALKSDRSGAPYLGRTLSGVAQFAEASGADQLIDISVGTADDWQGPIYDYGSSTSRFTIPSGVSKCYFVITYNPGNTTLNLPTSVVSSSAVVKTEKNGAFFSSSSVYVNSDAAGAASTFTIKTGIADVVTSDYFEFKLNMNASHNVEAFFRLSFNIELIPVFEVS